MSKGEDLALSPLVPGRHLKGIIWAWGIYITAIWIAALLLGRHIPSDNPRVQTTRTAVEVLSTWDGSHYRIIATKGYSAEGDAARRLAFFPLFPLLARTLGGKESCLLAGILLSQLCLLGSLVILTQLTDPQPDSTGYHQPGIWLLVSPLSFFLAVFYSESLFLFLSLLGVRSYRTGQLGAALLCNLLAGLTRPMAVTLPALYLYEAWEAWQRRERWMLVCMVGLAPVAGVLIYYTAVGVLLDNPLGYFDIQSRWAWQHAWTIPFKPLLSDAKNLFFNALHLNFSGMQPDRLVRVALSFSAITLAIVGRRKVDRSFLLYLVLSLVFIHSQVPNRGTARYELVLFPVFLILARTPLATRRVMPILAAALLLLQVKFFFDFVMWRWVA